MQRWKLVVPGLVLYLNIAHSCHEYYEANTLVFALFYS